MPFLVLLPLITSPPSARTGAHRATRSEICANEPRHPPPHENCTNELPPRTPEPEHPPPRKIHERIPLSARTNPPLIAQNEPKRGPAPRRERTNELPGGANEPARRAMPEGAKRAREPRQVIGDGVATVVVSYRSSPAQSGDRAALDPVQARAEQARRGRAEIGDRGGELDAGW